MISGRALRAGKAVIELSLLSGNIEKDLKKLERKMQNFGKALSSIGSAGLKFSAALGAPLLAAVKQAADAREELAKFEAVFGDQAKAASDFAETRGKSIGRSANDIRSGMNAFQGFFVGLGFGNEEARKLTENIQKLSHDFAAFHNLSDQEAMDRFISALSGSSEVLDRFGVNTRQAAIEQALLERGIDKTWTAVTESEKAVARLDIIMRAMGDQGAVGAAVRESDSFANQLKRVQGQAKDAAIAIGNVLLPRVTDFLARLNDVVSHIGKWLRQKTELIAGLGSLVVNVGLASGGLVAMGKSFEIVAKAAGLARIAIVAMAAHPVIAAVAALTAGVGFLTTAFGEAEEAAKKLVREGSAALQGLALEQLKSMKSSLEWKIFFEKLDYRQLWDEGMAGQRTEAERALAAVNNRIEELEAAMAAGESPVAASPAGSPQAAAIAAVEAGPKGMAFSRKMFDGFRDAMAAAQVTAQAKIMRAQFELRHPMQRLREVIDGLADLPMAGGGILGESVFDTRFAPQIFGRSEERQVELLEAIRRNTDPRNQAGNGGGVPVV